MNRDQIIEQLIKLQDRMFNLELAINDYGIYGVDELEDIRHDLTDLISQLARITKETL